MKFLQKVLKSVWPPKLETGASGTQSTRPAINSIGQPLAAAHRNQHPAGPPPTASAQPQGTAAPKVPSTARISSASRPAATGLVATDAPSMALPPASPTNGSGASLRGAHSVGGRAHRTDQIKAGDANSGDLPSMRLNVFSPPVATPAALAVRPREEGAAGQVEVVVPSVGLRPSSNVAGAVVARGSRDAEEARPNSSGSQLPPQAAPASSTNKPRLLPHGRTVDLPHLPHVSPETATRRSTSVVHVQEAGGNQVKEGAETGTRNDNKVSEANKLFKEVHAISQHVEENYGHLRREPPSGETFADYRRTLRNALKKGVGTIDMDLYQNSNTRQKVRAAIVWHALNLVDGLVDRLRPLAVTKAIDEAIALMQPVVEAKNHLAAIEGAPPVGDAKDNGQRTNTEREMLRRLPDGWEVRILDAISAEMPDWRLPACVMLTMGARPVEVAKGAVVSLTVDGLLAIRVKSAKQGRRGRRSIGYRTVYSTNDAPWTRILALAVSENGEPLTVFFNGRKHASTIFTRISAKAGFGKSIRVVPYTFRHRFGALLKTSGLELIDQSRAMGHGSTTAISGYGVHNSRISRVGGIVRVTSDREPRLVERANAPPSRSKKAPKPV